MLEDCLKAFMTVFEAWLPRLKDLPESYTSRLFQKGVQARYIDYLRDGEEFTGTILGVSPDGRLVIYDGITERFYSFKEVGYIL